MKFLPCLTLNNTRENRESLFYHPDRDVFTYENGESIIEFTEDQHPFQKRFSLEYHSFSMRTKTTNSQNHTEKECYSFYLPTSRKMIQITLALSLLKRLGETPCLGPTWEKPFKNTLSFFKDENDAFFLKIKIFTAFEINYTGKGGKICLYRFKKPLQKPIRLQNAIRSRLLTREAMAAISHDMRTIIGNPFTEHEMLPIIQDMMSLTLKDIQKAHQDMNNHKEQNLLFLKNLHALTKEMRQKIQTT